MPGKGRIGDERMKEEGKEEERERRERREEEGREGAVMAVEKEIW